MPKATFLGADGAPREVQVELGRNLMLAACDHSIEGIVADCGGAATCATCHVFVDEGYVQEIGPMEPNENTILDFTAAPRQPNSRLACQIVMTERLDGIVVRVADPQV